ncbi:tektin-4 [Anoplophora glabripennis]|uniref:tektin-4 n=1 Tax=Anoplophora glabripennis TaxID=217634 RepID=UPI000C774626|nr:tektin-4 [Anoplophora glabripennis]
MVIYRVTTENGNGGAVLSGDLTKAKHSRASGTVKADRKGGKDDNILSAERAVRLSVPERDNSTPNHVVPERETRLTTTCVSTHRTERKWDTTFYQQSAQLGRMHRTVTTMHPSLSYVGGSVRPAFQLIGQKKGETTSYKPNSQFRSSAPDRDNSAPFLVVAVTYRWLDGRLELGTTDSFAGRGPCYLPQPQDSMPLEETGNMGPIGPWATGRVDWGPLGGLTGTRPVVDKYSIARYSEGDWRAHNKVILEMSNVEQHRANLVDWNGRQCLEQSQADVTATQEDNTKKLNQRELEIHRWKCELERAIAAASEEIYFMEEQRRRLKQASSVLTWPESIAGECLERRTGRMDAELVRDEVEDELIKELALCSEIRDIFNRTLKDVEKQLLEDKTAKQKLEMDWSDKTVAHEIDSINMALNCGSTILLFKPGSVIFPEGQSSTDYWEHFTRETLLEGEATRQRSVTLRGTLDAILNNAARDLRTQADKVELALAKRIACTEEVTKKLEYELLQVLRRLADVEDLMKDLRAAIRRMDTPMKKAQTRLDNRLLRPRVENCRDVAHFGYSIFIHYVYIKSNPIKVFLVSNIMHLCFISLSGRFMYSVGA